MFGACRRDGIAGNEADAIMFGDDRAGQGEAILLPLTQGRLESVLSMMQLEPETLLVAVCESTVKATSMQALLQRGVGWLGM